MEKCEFHLSGMIADYRRNLGRVGKMETLSILQICPRGAEKAGEPLDFVCIMICWVRSLTVDKGVMNVDQKYPVDLLMFNANFLWWNTIFIFKQSYCLHLRDLNSRYSMHLIFTYN